VFQIDAVKFAQSTGTFNDLKAAVGALQDTVKKLDTTADKTDDSGNHVEQNSINIADEETVMEKYGRALRQVSSLRDTYITQSCDVCEQLRKDTSSLKSYEGKKGFDSEKMTEITNLLYQHKTRFEDIDRFLETTHICKYCADKLKGNKDVARSAFNCLGVVPTPPCIEQLNIFEKNIDKVHNDKFGDCSTRTNIKQDKAIQRTDTSIERENCIFTCRCNRECQLFA
jgi:hypothetical protein